MPFVAHNCGKTKLEPHKKDEDMLNPFVHWTPYLPYYNHGMGQGRYINIVSHKEYCVSTFHEWCLMKNHGIIKQIISPLPQIFQWQNPRVHDLCFLPNRRHDVNHINVDTTKNMLFKQLIAYYDYMTGPCMAKHLM